MERRCHNFSRPHGDWVLAFGGNYFNFATDAFNFWRADENHFRRLVQKFTLANGALHLPAVSIASNGNVENAQAALLRVLDFLGQKNRACAGAECGLHAHELLQLVETLLTQEL